MKPVMQTTFGTSDDAPPNERGNCVQASLASIFELPLKETVNPAVEPTPAKFWAAIDVWLAEKDLLALHFHPEDVKFDPLGEAYCLLHGKTSRGSRHTIVGQMSSSDDRPRKQHSVFYPVHDPMGKDGLAKVISITLFVRRLSNVWVR